MSSANKLEKFGGRLPAWSDRLLPPGQGAVAQNCYMFSGELVGWRVPKFLRNLTDPAALRVFRVPVVTKTVATNTLTVAVNPNNGDTATVGEDTYTFTTLVRNQFDVLIGASAAATANNFLAALTGDAGLFTNRGTLYGPNTEPSEFIDQSGALKTPPVDLPNLLAGAAVTIFAPSFGSAYNTTTFAESTGGARLQWASATFTGGSNAAFDPTIQGASTWLEFDDRDTDVIRSPVVNDQFNRIYFASPSQPPKYNTYDRIAAGQPPFYLGVRAPGCAPVITVAGGGNLTQLGNPTSTTSGTYAPLANRLVLMPITPTGSLTLNDVAFVPAGTDAIGNFAAVVYDNAGPGNGPGNLLNVGNIVTGATAGAQLTSTFTNPTGLLVNQTYWIGFITDSNVQWQLADNGNTQKSISIPDTFSNSPSPVAPTGGHQTLNVDLQMWADLTTSAVIETRYYAYTWVTAYGEEGPPSATANATGWSNATWTIGLFQPQLADQGQVRNITKVRIYRTIPDQSGGTQYFQVTEQPIGTTNFVDNLDDSVVALNTILPSNTWFEPPANLQGFTALPNGMIAAFRANEVWFCEPYQPHAWPPSNVITVEFPIVGLGVHMNSVVICTNAKPSIATGETPQSMALTKIDIPEPCLARGSILSTEGGVYYASPNGLIRVTQSGVGVNTTEQWITRDKWQQLIPQSSLLRAVLMQSLYFCYQAGSQTGFTIELSAGDSQSFSIFPQPGGHRIGFGTLTAPNNINVDALTLDPWSGQVMMIQSSQVLFYDFTDPAPVLMPYKWRSPILVQPFKKNYQAMRTTFVIPPGTPAQHATRNTAPTLDPSWATLQAGQYGIIRVYADGVLVTTRELWTNLELQRILSGFKATEWQFEIEAVVQVAKLEYATSVKELKQV